MQAGHINAQQGSLLLILGTTKQFGYGPLQTLCIARNTHPPPPQDPKIGKNENGIFGITEQRVPRKLLFRPHFWYVGLASEGGVGKRVQLTGTIDQLL